jgi:hypothetical protein
LQDFFSVATSLLGPAPGFALPRKLYQPGAQEIVQF